MTPLRLLLQLVSLAVLSGCASVSVKNVERHHSKGLAFRPGKIFVQPFTFTEQAVRVDRSGESLEEFKSDLNKRVTAGLVERIGRFVPEAVELPRGARIPRGKYLLLTGNFDRVNQGSRALRSVVGLGAGATKMDSTVMVYDLSPRVPRPLVRIQTTGGSNISPGVTGVATIFISGPMALTNLFNVVDGVRSGVSFDASRTAREVSAALSEFLVQEQALEKEKALKPKRLGEPLNRLDAGGRRQALESGQN